MSTILPGYSASTLGVDRNSCAQCEARGHTRLTCTSPNNSPTPHSNPRTPGPCGCRNLPISHHATGSGSILSQFIYPGNPSNSDPTRQLVNELREYKDEQGNQPFRFATEDALLNTANSLLASRQAAAAAALARLTGPPAASNPSPVSPAAGTPGVPGTLLPPPPPPPATATPGRLIRSQVVRSQDLTTQRQNFLQISQANVGHGDLSALANARGLTFRSLNHLFARLVGLPPANVTVRVLALVSQTAHTAFTSATAMRAAAGDLYETTMDATGASIPEYEFRFSPALTGTFDRQLTIAVIVQGTAAAANTATSQIFGQIDFSVGIMVD